MPSEKFLETYRTDFTKEEKAEFFRKLDEIEKREEKRKKYITSLISEISLLISTVCLLLVILQQ